MGRSGLPKPRALQSFQVMIQLGGPMLVVTCIGMAFLRLLLSISSLLESTAQSSLRYVWQCTGGCLQRHAGDRHLATASICFVSGATFRYSLTRIRPGLCRRHNFFAEVRMPSPWHLRMETRLRRHAPVGSSTPMWMSGTQEPP